MPRADGDEVEWDFSFVGPRRNGPRPESPAVAAPSGDGVDWDFSFVGERRSSGRTAAESPAVEAPASDEVDWDFSFVGEPRNQTLQPTEPAHARDAEVTWDFSFVDGSTDTLPAPAPEPPSVEFEHPPTEVIDVVRIEPFDEPLPPPASDDVPDRIGWSAGDDRAEPADGSTDHSTGELDRATGIDGMSGRDGVSGRDGMSAFDQPTGDLERPIDDGIAPTDELARPARIDALDAAEPSLAADTGLAAGAGGLVSDPTPFRSPRPTHNPDPVKVLAICTHNRTRSVMMMAMLQAGFDRSVGEGRVMVRSLGFGPEGEPAIDDAVAEMAARGLDVSGHRSLQVNTARVEPADLILTAERDHVAKVAEASPEAFRRTFTLPEFCRLIADDPVPGARTLREWLGSMSAARTPATYLSADVPEVDDPTGSPPRQFALATQTIESMCDTVVDLLEVSVGRPSWR